MNPEDIEFEFTNPPECLPESYISKLEAQYTEIARAVYREQNND